MGIYGTQGLPIRAQWTSPEVLGCELPTTTSPGGPVDVLWWIGHPHKRIHGKLRSMAMSGSPQNMALYGTVPLYIGDNIQL